MILEIKARNFEICLINVVNDPFMETFDTLAWIHNNYTVTRYEIRSDGSLKCVGLKIK